MMKQVTTKHCYLKFCYFEGILIKGSCDPDASSTCPITYKNKMFILKLTCFVGEVDDENDVSEDRDWNEYWRVLFKKISVEDILEFEQKYKGITIGSRNLSRGGGGHMTCGHARRPSFFDKF